MHVEDVRIGRLPGFLGVPVDSRGVVVFAHGSGSSRRSPRNQFVAASLRRAGFTTLLLDLLTEPEEESRRNVFDVPLLTARLGAAVDWARGRPELAGLPVALFGASTGAAAALSLAAVRPADISAVVCRGGRPDLAPAALPMVRCPTLLIVGGRDDVVVDLNRRAAAEMRTSVELLVVPGATHLFEEPGTLETVAERSAEFLAHHLTGLGHHAQPASR